ncbi:hypothetical protein FK178_15280 [Antarcticibacterium arcticum]|uniref:Uncharacterized protein n=1 Tax=Antarcticibacterium arcticum TaxID=2585771 RepID=A0A5B8YMN0_9FLAO|nr:hypothetical protein [Antarcticibacterium arcticum]QED38994.1 hypothetical protein FK178_15280 [Antarcticibacterium arcticum]
MENIKWSEKDQLKKFNDWIILPTNENVDVIKIISLNLNSETKTDYLLDLNSDQTGSIWKVQDSKPESMEIPAEMKIDTIINKKIFIKYTLNHKNESIEDFTTLIIEYEKEEESGFHIFKTIQKID